jgi:hypothetical protein
MSTPAVTLRLTTALLAAVLVSGCSHTGTYNSAYLAAARRPATSSGEGKVLIVMPPSDRSYVFEGHPTSFTGGGTTMSLPIGQITLETARSVFGDRFKEGIDSGEEAKAGYAAIVRPKVEQFSYQYNQLRNLGFAITPMAHCKLSLSVLGADGAVKSQKSYDSGDVEGSSYMVSTEYFEKVSEVAHRAIYGEMTKAADEVVAAMKVQTVTVAQP